MVKYTSSLPGSLISIASALSLLGCASAPPIVTKPIPVVIEKDRYIPLAPDLVAPCQGRPPAMREGMTNGDLLWIAIGYERSYSKCLEEKLESIRRLQPK